MALYDAARNIQATLEGIQASPADQHPDLRDGDEPLEDTVRKLQAQVSALSAALAEMAQQVVAQSYLTRQRLGDDEFLHGR